MTLEEYFKKHGSCITQPSERLFVDEFLFPLLGSQIEHVIPQRPFLDSTGKSRRIDFSFVSGSLKLALEVNGESYHAEGIIPDANFDDNLFRQNEILRDGYKLIRFSYSMLQSPQWRPVVMDYRFQILEGLQDILSCPSMEGPDGYILVGEFEIGTAPAFATAEAEHRAVAAIADFMGATALARARDGHRLDGQRLEEIAERFKIIPYPPAPDFGDDGGTGDSFQSGPSGAEG